MDFNNFNNSTVDFAIRVPISLSVVTPLVTSSTILDEYALLFSSALGSPQLDPKRQQIEDAITTGPMSHIPRSQLTSALRSLALDSAQILLSKFLADLEERFYLAETVGKPIPRQETPKTIKPSAAIKHDTFNNELEEKWSSPDRTRRKLEEVPRQKVEEDAKRKETGLKHMHDETAAQKKRQDEEPARKKQEETLRKKQTEHPAADAAAAKAKPDEKVAKQAAKTVLRTRVGAKVEDPGAVEALNLIGECPNGYTWTRIDKGFVCSGGGHNVWDSQLS
ncbi:MAG: hypothetical protein Q9201_000088 [Fulgogasparrea decipioides]